MKKRTRAKKKKTPTPVASTSAPSTSTALSPACLPLVVSGDRQQETAGGEEAGAGGESIACLPLVVSGDRQQEALGLLLDKNNAKLMDVVGALETKLLSIKDGPSALKYIQRFKFINKDKGRPVYTAAVAALTGAAGCAQASTEEEEEEGEENEVSEMEDD